MADTITHTWQTVEQAAVTLNVSTRTIARRLANGSLESRVDENGRRLVLVQQIGPADMADTGLEVEETTLAASAASTATPVATTTNTAPSNQAMAMLNVLQTTVTIAREDAVAARRSAKWAWGGVGFMALTIVASAVIVSSMLTRSLVSTEMLQTQLTDKKQELTQTTAELMATRSEVAVAKRDLVVTRGDLDKQKEMTAAATAARQSAEQSAQTAAASVNVRPSYAGMTNMTKTPTTQPQAQNASLLNRVVSLLAEEK
jgi:hypothetical protein